MGFKAKKFDFVHQTVFVVRGVVLLNPPFILHTIKTERTRTRVDCLTTGGYNHWTGLVDYWTGLLDSPKLQNTTHSVQKRS